jgi:hypothetical protein
MMSCNNFIRQLDVHYIADNIHKAIYMACIYL